MDRATSPRLRAILHRRGAAPQRSWRIWIDAKRREGKIDEAAKAWLCALTAFEIAKRLAGEQAVLGEDVSSKIGSAIETFGSLKQRIERVQIECYDQSAIEAHYLPSDGYSRAPAIICISAEDETSTKLLGRLLPAAAHRGMSVLAVTYDDVSDNQRGHSSEVLSCCLDYLSTCDTSMSRASVCTAIRWG